MRYTIGMMSNAEPPKEFLSKIQAVEERGFVHKGVPEIDFPSDWWEYFDKAGRRFTNYPEFKPRRYGKYYGFLGFDFDTKRLPTTVLTFLLDRTSDYWRPSSSGKGIHILSRSTFLGDFEDQRRAEFTKIRGYEWLWLSKCNKDERIKKAHRFFFNDGKMFVSTRYHEFKKMTKVDVMRLFNFESRNFGRRLSRKKFNKLHRVVIR